MRTTRAVLVLFVMLLASVAPGVIAEGRSAGVDLTVTDTSFAYTTPSDEGKFRMFSSNHPIPGFNRPASLFVIDAMVNVPIELSVTVTNLGTVASQRSDVRLIVLHDEYDRFEILNSTEPLNPVSGGSSGVVSFTVTPTYAGNHSLEVHVLQTTTDDNPSNDVYRNRMTVGAFYWNCDTLTNWTATGEWGLNSDTSISMGSSCHAGNGEGSTYGANTVSRLTTPMLDLSDGLRTGTRTMGLSFFYTGWVLSPDVVAVEARTASGGWEQIASFSPTIDNEFTQSDWNTFSIASGGHATPMLPIAPDRHLHAGSAFRWTMTTDSSGQDVGFWFDETVVVYDQAAKSEAYELTVTGLGTQGAVPGSWGEVDLRVANTGNISTSVRPSIDGLPSGWESYTLFADGSSVPSNGFSLLPGASRDVTVRMKPDANATVGLVSLTFNAATDHPSVQGTSPIGFTVLADRIPVLTPPEIRPTCAPQQSCAFSMELSNQGAGTDVFDLNVDVAQLNEGWTVDLAWSQPSSVLVRPGESVDIDLVLSVPQGAAPDTVSTFTMLATAQNDTSRVAELDVDVAASMVSDVMVELVSSFGEVVGGSTTSLTLSLENLASRMDEFDLDAEVEDEGAGWNIAGLSRTQAVLTAGASTTVRIDLQAPVTLDADDEVPRVRLLLHSERSGMNIASSWFDGPSIQVISSGSIFLAQAVQQITPNVAQEVHVSVTNTGNTGQSVDILATGMPEGWTVWTRVNDVNTTGPFQLQSNGSSGDSMLVSLLFLAPVQENAGQRVSVGLELLAGEVSLDSTSLEFLIQPVRLPGLTLFDADRGLASGQTATLLGEVLNLGNTPEQGTTLHVSVQTTPPMPNLMVLLSVDGGSSLDLDMPHPVPLASQTSKEFQVDVAVPEDALLGARIVVNVRVEGGLDEEGRPYILTGSHLFEVDSRREVVLGVVAENGSKGADGQGQSLTLSMASSSSFIEDLNVSFDHPEGWSVVCDGYGLVEQGLNFSMNPGHIVTQERRVVCTVLRGEGPLDGVVRVMLVAADGTALEEEEHAFAWQAPAADASGLSSTVVAGGGIGLLVLVAVTALLLRRRSKEDQLEVDVPVKHSQPEALPGPVATSQEVSTVVANGGPPLPATGLPAGWTMEQWVHYGAQWLAQQPTEEP